MTDERRESLGARDDAASQVAMPDVALPARAARLLRRAEQWLRVGDEAAAENALAEARDLAPGHPEILLAQADLRRKQQRPAQALALTERAAAQRPHDAATLVRMGRAQRDARRFADSIATFRQACETDPLHADAWFNLGTMLFMTTQNAAADDAFERARQLTPTHVPTLMAQAVNLQTLGRTAESAARLREAIAIQPDMVFAWQSLTNLKTEHLSETEVAQLEKVYASAALTDDARAVAGFALADALERQHRYADAYAVLERANAIKRAGIDWDAQWFSGTVDRSIEVFSADVARAADPTLGHEAIFVISLPRSGSTLTEQILSAHSDVEGGGELRELGTVIEEESARRQVLYPDWVATATPNDWERLGRRYLELTRHVQKRVRFTDKGLSNWQLLGALFAMLPGATVIHARRDPVETCWSCFKQLFQVGQPFTYDLGELATFWHDYDRAMTFWNTRYPGRVHDVVYEDLVRYPDTQIRALLEHAGLRFEDACLNFHESTRHVRTPSASQVRQPLRKDTARAPRYGELLDPLRAALDRATASSNAR